MIDQTVITLFIMGALTGFVLGIVIGRFTNWDKEEEKKQ